MCSCRGPSTCKQGRRLYKRCSCKQWPCTYTAPCVARTCWEESQTHIAAPLWQRRSTHPARALIHAANAPRRGRSCTDQQHHTPPQHRQQNAQHHPHTYDQTARWHPGHTQHTPTQPRSDTQQPALEAVQHPQPHTIRPPDSTKARPTIKPDRLFLLHDGTGHRPAETIGKNHTARPPPALPAASIFRRGDQPQIRQGENHQHDHSPAPNKSGPALEADHSPRREQQPPRPRSDRLRTSSQTGTCCTRPCDGKTPRRTLPNTQHAAPRPSANLAA